MKIVLLNYEEGCIDVLPVRTDAAAKIKAGAMTAEEYITSCNLNTSSFEWMVNEDDDVQVFWNGESIPYTSL